MTTRFFGKPIKRVEDPFLLMGKGRFTDDIPVAGMLHAAFVRSPYARARVRCVDHSRARQAPGVHLALSAADLPERLRLRRIPLDVPSAFIRQPITQTPLAVDEVCFCGEAVAVVIADNKHLAEDAAAAVVVDYEPLEPVVDPSAALRPDGPTAHVGISDNIAAKFHLSYGDADMAFSTASRTLSAEFHVHRGAGSPLETRAVLATYDDVSNEFTIWSATQAPHGVKRAVVEYFELSDRQVRVIAADVGGGFGPKLLTYPEEIVIPYCARLLGRPVKWVEDRREHLICTAQERDQTWTVKLALDKSGKILGLSGHLLHDTGAFVPWGIVMPYIAATTLPGPYVVPAFKFDTSVVFTNKVATAPMRGAGRPQAVFAMERLLDMAASEMGIDRAEMRRRNLIPESAMPYKVGLTYRDGQPLSYDSGNYPQCQQMALDLAGWESFEDLRRDARKQGRYVGIGLANYVEGTGLGPFEGATARVQRSGRILLRTGAAAQGQGHMTVLAQICADEFNIDVGQIDVEVGDTASVAVGVGAFASRVMVNAGSAVQDSSRRLAAKVKRIAAAYFGVTEDDVELLDGVAKVSRSQGASISFSEIAGMTSGRPGFCLPSGIEPGLEVTKYFPPEQATYSNGSHIAIVEADPETGSVKVLRYIVAHDCGKLVNPLLVEGQVQGGVAHGIGNALLEHVRYDEQGNPVTTTLADYLLPQAGDVPEVEIVHMESPSPFNPLGVKGAGEGGTIPATAAIASAVDDALRDFGVSVAQAPMLPETIASLISTAERELSKGAKQDAI